MKNGDRARPGLFQKNRKRLPATISKNVRNKKDVVGADLFFEIHATPPQHAIELSQRILTAPFRTSGTVPTGFERSGEKTKLLLATFGINGPNFVPGNRSDIKTHIELRENLPRHPLHPVLLRRTPRTRNVNDDPHLP